MPLVSKHTPMEPALWDALQEAAKARAKRLSNQTGARVTVSGAEFVRVAIANEIEREKELNEGAPAPARGRAAA